MWVRTGRECCAELSPWGERRRWETHIFKAPELIASKEARSRRGVEKCIVRKTFIYIQISSEVIETDVEILAERNRCDVTASYTHG